MVLPGCQHHRVALRVHPQPLVRPAHLALPAPLPQRTPRRPGVWGKPSQRGGGGNAAPCTVPCRSRCPQPGAGVSPCRRELYGRETRRRHVPRRQGGEVRHDRTRRGGRRRHRRRPVPLHGAPPGAQADPKGLVPLRRARPLQELLDPARSYTCKGCGPRALGAFTQNFWRCASPSAKQSALWRPDSLRQQDCWPQVQITVRLGDPALKVAQARGAGTGFN